MWRLLAITVDPLAVLQLSVYSYNDQSQRVYGREMGGMALNVSHCTRFQ